MHNSITRLSSDINHFYAKTRPTSDLLEEKEKLFSFISDCVSYLHSQFQEQINEGTYSPASDRGFFLDNMATKTSSQSWRVFKFGSEAWGTSCGDSDIDIAVWLNFRNNRFDKKFMLKTLSRTISANDADDQLRVQLILTATYPIIRVFHRHEKHLKVDISIADRYCQRRTEWIASLLRYYEHKLNLPLKKLIIFVKTWAKARGINSAYHGFLNSYGFTLLILRFVQSLVDEHRHILRFKKSVGVLAMEFFEFYVLRFDLSAYAVRLDSNRSAPRKNRARERFPRKRRCDVQMEIMDPVNCENNVAHNVGYAQYQRIGFEFIRAFKIMRGNTTQTSSDGEVYVPIFHALLAADYPLQHPVHHHDAAHDTAHDDAREISSVTDSKSEHEDEHDVAIASVADDKSTAFSTDTELESEPHCSEHEHDTSSESVVEIEDKSSTACSTDEESLDEQVHEKVKVELKVKGSTASVTSSSL